MLNDNVKITNSLDLDISDQQNDKQKMHRNRSFLNLILSAQNKVVNESKHIIWGFNYAGILYL